MTLDNENEVRYYRIKCFNTIFQNQLVCIVPYILDTISLIVINKNGKSQKLLSVAQLLKTKTFFHFPRLLLLYFEIYRCGA